MPYLHIYTYYQRLASLDDYWFWRAWHYENACMGIIHSYELEWYI